MMTFRYVWKNAIARIKTALSQQLCVGLLFVSKNGVEWIFIKY